MKAKVFTALSILALATTANALPNKPAKCPGVGSLIIGGLSRQSVEKAADGLWAVGLRKNKYDTKDTWTFVVGRIIASDANDAYTKAAGSLNSLSLIQGPIYVAQTGKWTCYFNTAPGYLAVTVSPSIDGLMSKLTKTA